MSFRSKISEVKIELIEVKENATLLVTNAGLENQHVY